MKTIEIIFATISLLLIIVSFPVLTITGNMTLAMCLGFSGIICLGFWLASDFI
jgi:hypothetical protein